MSLPRKRIRARRSARAAAAACATASSCRSPTRRRARASRPRAARTTRRRRRGRGPATLLRSPLADREVLLDVLDLEQARRCSRHAIAPSASSPICPSATTRRLRFSSTASQQRSRWPGASGSRASSAGVLRALRELVPAARAEVAALGPVDERRRQPGDRRQALGPRPVDARDRPEQPPRVRVLRVVEDLVERPGLDDPPAVHHRDAVGDVGDDAEVVGHEDDRGAAALAQVAHLAQDLRLDRHVERGRRLVGDQHGRVARQRHRDHHALAHAAGELVRVAVDALARARDADALEQRDDAIARLGVGDVLVRLDLLDDLRADAVHRVQRRHRVLEDHRDLLAADPRSSSSLAVISSCPRRWAVPLKRAFGERVRPMSVIAVTDLPEPDSPTTASTSPGLQRERHAVDGVHDAVLGAELDLEVVDLEQVAVAGGHVEADPRVEQRRRRCRRAC